MYCQVVNNIYFLNFCYLFFVIVLGDLEYNLSVEDTVNNIPPIELYLS